MLRSFAGRLANMEVSRAWGSWVALIDDNAKMRTALLTIASPLLHAEACVQVRAS